MVVLWNYFGLDDLRELVVVKPLYGMYIILGMFVLGFVPALFYVGQKYVFPAFVVTGSLFVSAIGSWQAGPVRAPVGVRHHSVCMFSSGSASSRLQGWPPDSSVTGNDETQIVPGNSTLGVLRRKHARQLELSLVDGLPVGTVLEIIQHRSPIPVLIVR